MKKSLLRKRLYLLSVLLLMVCGQTWANYGNGKPDYGTRCNGNTPTKTVIVDGVMYSLYGNQNYTYSYESYTCGTSGSGNYAVAVYAQQYDTRSELTIKSTIQDGGTTYTVVAIGEQFFWYNKSATKLTIPATVQTLETFALEDNTGNLREIVIEDSGNKLECYRTTNSYGAFSWNGGLKKVYIGRELYAVGGIDYYYYAPFYEGDFTDLEVTLGPQVPYINSYTFYNNSIKSIKAMSQQPPNWAAYAFGGVSSTIPVYVSYKTIDTYKAHLNWKYFTNYVLDLDLCRADALKDLDAEAGQNPSAAVLAIVSDYKGRVNAATSGDEVVAKLNAGKTAIQLQKAKEAAIAELNEAAKTYPSDAADGIVETYTGIINAATTTDAVNSAKNEGIQKLVEAKALQDAKTKAIAELKAEAGDSPSQAVAELRDTWIANVNNATTVADVDTRKANGIAAIQLQKVKETAIAELSEAAKDYPSDAANDIVSTYTDKINAATNTDAVTQAKNEGIAKIRTAYVLQKEKADAIAALNEEAGKNPSDAVMNILNGYTTQINAATSITDVEPLMNNGIAAIQLQKVKETAIAELSEAAKEYPSDAADEIVSTYTDKINAATTTDAVTAARDEGIQKLVEAKALQDAKAAAIAELKAEAGDSPSKAVAALRDTWVANVNNATTVADVDTRKANGIAAIQLQKAKEAAIAELSKAAKDYPSDAADEIVSTYTDKINATTTTDVVTAAKNEGIQALLDAYNAQIELQNAKETAIDELSEAAKTYPSDAANGIVTTYTDRIKAATSITNVTKEKEAGIKALMDAKDLQDAKEAAISYMNDAKKDYPSDESEDIVSTYTSKINAATTIDAVTAAKEAGIQALAYAAEMPTVLHINFAEGSAPIEKEHYMTASTFTLDEDCNVVLTVNGNSVTYPFDKVGKITLFKGVSGVEIKANKDPKNEKGDYYTTFYSSLEAYTIPKGVKAYTATLDEEQDGVVVLNEIKDGVIPAETAVVLISESGSYSAYTCDYVLSETEERGILKGKDIETPVPDDNCYVLSGTSKLGMGLYPWTGTGKTLAANKAYLQLTESSLAKAFTFVFDDETTGIQEASPKSSPGGKDLYNLNGIRVNDSYKGIVIKKGKKIYQK